MPTLFPTTLVGSYPQPEWLIDRGRLAKHVPPRVRASELWRGAETLLAQTQEYPPMLAHRAQEETGPGKQPDGASPPHNCSHPSPPPHAATAPDVRFGGHATGFLRLFRGYPPFTSASATRSTSRTSPPATLSCPSSPTARAIRCRSRPRSPGSTARF